VKYYAVAELDVTEPSWVADYVADVTPMVERRGGRYLARTAQIEQIEGERTPPQVLLIIEWPSRQAANDFYESDEYRSYREARRAGARNEFLLIAGDDVNGVARIAEQSVERHEAALGIEPARRGDGVEQRVGGLGQQREQTGEELARVRL
jgi:uncharacterized protein (DUF1330 family)